MTACNLVSLLSQTVLDDEIQAKLSTVRFKCFAKGGLDKKVRLGKGAEAAGGAPKEAAAGRAVQQGERINPPKLEKFHEIRVKAVFYGRV